jgi:two-component system, sensor histidine kinase and response regulator
MVFSSPTREACPSGSGLVCKRGLAHMAQEVTMAWKRLNRDVDAEKDASDVLADLMPKLGIVVFACDGTGGYRRLGPAPDWLSAFVPAGTPVDDARDLPFSFLGVFLDACDGALQNPDKVPVLREIWHERDQSGQEHSFSIRFVERGDAPHLLLECLDQNFAEQQAVLQQARDQKLILDALVRTEAELRESQQQLALIMRHAPAVFWCTDVDATLTYCSESAGDTFAECGGGRVGSPVTVLFRDSDISGDLVQSAHEIALAGELATFSLTFGRRSFDVRVEPLHVDTGQPLVGTIGVAVESTERVKAEADAAAAMNAKADFVTGISHEIRTPMNAIIGLTELALDLPLVPEQRVYLQSAITSAESLLGVIDQLLDFSRIEQGSRVLDRVAFSLDALLTEVLSGLAVHAHGKGLELVALIDENVPDAVVGDSGRLRQILVNLVGNAIKFTHEGEVTVHVSRESCEGGASGVQLHVRVCDTGIGVLPEKQELIFDAFRQAEPGTIRKYGGTGLGLAIALELTRLLEGRVWVVSPGEQGRGSDFHFTVILEVGEPPEDAVFPSIPEEALPSSCLLVGRPGFSLEATRRMLETQFGEIAEIPVALDGVSTVSIPVADASGVLVVDVPADADMRRRLLDALERHPRFAGSVIAVCPVGLPNAELDALHSLSAAIVLKPLKCDALQSVLRAKGRAGEADSETAAPAEVPSQSLRILIAEDDELSQWVLARICRNRGHEVTLVSNGADAVSQSRSRAFDVLLLDLQLPDFTGHEATRLIRRFEEEWHTNPELRSERGGDASDVMHLPIVALTAHVGIEVRDRCLASGMDGYLAKPVRARELFSLLEKLLLNSEGRDARRDSSLGCPLDFEQLDALVGGDHAVKKRVIATAVELLPSALEGIEESLRMQSFAAVKADAHRLKGMSGNIGARDLSTAAASLERASARQDLAGSRAKLVEMQSECDRLLRFLEVSGDGSGQEG